MALAQVAALTPALQQQLAQVIAACKTSDCALQLAAFAAAVQAAGLNVDEALADVVTAVSSDPAVAKDQVASVAKAAADNATSTEAKDNFTRVADAAQAGGGPETAAGASAA